MINTEQYWLDDVWAEAESKIVTEYIEIFFFWAAAAEKYDFNNWTEAWGDFLKAESDDVIGGEGYVPWGDLLEFELVEVHSLHLYDWHIARTGITDAMLSDAETDELNAAIYDRCRFVVTVANMRRQIETFINNRKAGVR